MNQPPPGFFDEHDDGHVNGAARPPIDFASPHAANDASASGPTIEFLDHDDLFAPEPKADLLVGALGIAPGPATGIFGQSYVGKSILVMSIAMSIALGRDLLGVWRVRRGPWVHVDYEQGRRRCKTLVQRLAFGFDVGKEELREWIRVAVYPPVNLTTEGALDHYSRAFDGCAVATLDALKGMTPGIDENSSQMRDYMGLLARASEKTGCVPLLVHNAGKTPSDGKRPRKEAGRGSSAIFDECQSVFVATAEKGEPTHISHEKDRELGATVPDFYVRIVDLASVDGTNPKAGLRVLHVDSEEVGAAADSPIRRKLKEREVERDRIAEERKAKRDADERAAGERQAARQAQQDAEQVARRTREDAALLEILAKNLDGSVITQLRPAMAAALGGCGKDAVPFAIARLGARVRSEKRKNSTVYFLVTE